MHELVALLADDEAPARRRLRSLLIRLGGVRIAGEFAEGASLLAALEATSAIDVVFLDIRMPERSGIEIARALAIQNPPCVVFVTAFDRYAVDAFGVDAVDFLLKPIGLEQVARSIARVRERRRSPRIPARVACRRGDEEAFLDVSEIDWIEAAANYVKIHRGAEEWLVRETLDAMEQRLSRLGFVRTHRRSLVRLFAIRSVTSEGSVARAILGDGTIIPIGRRHLRNVRDRLRGEDDSPPASPSIPGA